MENTNIFKLIHTIEKINNEHIIHFTKAYSYPLGISPILALSELRSHGALKQVELANTLGYTKGAMTNIATKLVNLNLAVRQPDEHDKRTIRMMITPEGEKALSEAQTIGKKLFMDIFEVLSEEELNQYLMIQEKLLEAVTKEKRS
ncbi:MarR family winged helix-turn-helix transcriptional regulator [Gracilibacillus salinarum]|uniref:MarR family transcriptional regulator n=1 Tax=Gracilibacillus salinarum TaxID=2932255 RepID=A0ABY4GKZ4_9BACI|nr:MarR family transcriptional regulator [Gracilibacillus salinarum]UOQ84889.1 MarR family transcriptional regulator [Gracilibacillus salinarum]